MEWLVSVLVIAVFVGLLYIRRLVQQMKRMTQEAERVRKLHYQLLDEPRSEDKLRD